MITISDSVKEYIKENYPDIKILRIVENSKLHKIFVELGCLSDKMGRTIYLEKEDMFEVIDKIADSLIKRAFKKAMMGGIYYTLPIETTSYEPNTPKEENLPKRYIITKEATILFWSDDKKDKTIVKTSKGDKFDKRLGFLTAYFQKHSGLTKTQANKYLDNLVVDEKKGK